MGLIILDVEAAAGFGSSALFILAWLVEGSRTKHRTPPTIAKRTRTVLQQWLIWVQMLGTTVVFGLTVAYVLLLSSPQDNTRQPPSRASKSISLFGSLTWLVFCLLLLDSGQRAHHKLYIPWGWSTALNSISLVLTMSYDHDRTVRSSEMAVQLVRAAFLMVLMASVAVSPSCDTLETKSLPEQEDDDLAGAEELSSFRQLLWQDYVASYRIFLPHLRPHTAQQYLDLLLVIFATIIVRVSLVAQPLVLGAVVDNLHHRWIANLFLYIGMIAVTNLASTICWYSSSRLRTHWEANLREEAFTRTIGLSADYHLNKSTPQTIQVIDKGQSVVDLAFIILIDLLPSAADLVIMIITVGKLFQIEVCFTLAVAMVFHLWITKKKFDINTYKEYVQCWYSLDKLKSEVLTQWREVSEMGKEGYEDARHRRVSENVMHLYCRLLSNRLGLTILKEASMRLGSLIVLCVAIKDISAGPTTIGSFILLLTYWSQTFKPVATLVDGASDVAEKLADAERLVLLLKKEPSITDMPGAPAFQFRGGAVKFEKCTFAYPNGAEVLRDVSFEVLPGQKTALVGETGSGKSTIFQLICRHFDPCAGRVFVDDQDIKEVQLRTYRPHLGVIAQNPGFFSETLNYNITYANTNASLEEAIDACKKAQVHDRIIRFPRGYNEKVGEKGQTLSGGEKQRLAIARLLVNNESKLLLLDEITSNVDSVTEQKILDAFEEAAHGRTRLVIAHRLSTVWDADQILVVHEGQIVERGKHGDLLQIINGHYRKLWEAQFNAEHSIPETPVSGELSGKAVICHNCRAVVNSTQKRWFGWFGLDFMSWDPEQLSPL